MVPYHSWTLSTWRKDAWEGTVAPFFGKSEPKNSEIKSFHLVFHEMNSIKFSLSKKILVSWKTELTVVPKTLQRKMPPLPPHYKTVSFIRSTPRISSTHNGWQAETPVPFLVYKVCPILPFHYKEKIIIFLKFIFFKKATKIDEIFTIDLTITT